jgi:hypothetical protein
MPEMMACLNPSCFASFADCARYLLAEGLVAPERIAAVVPTRTAVIRPTDRPSVDRSGLHIDRALAHGPDDVHGTSVPRPVHESLPHDHSAAHNVPVFDEIVDNGSGNGQDGTS